MEKQFVPLVGGALFKDGKLLVVKRASHKEFLPNVWEIPGGKVNWGEDLNAALKREFMEETGLEIENLRPYNTWSYFPRKRGAENKFCIEIDYLVECENAGNVKISNEHDDFKWISKPSELGISTSEMAKTIEKAFEIATI